MEEEVGHLFERYSSSNESDHNIAALLNHEHHCFQIHNVDDPKYEIDLL